jgi:hypothetical protein
MSPNVGAAEIAAMKLHAIQTGTVGIKTAQVEGRGHGWSRRLAIFTDRNWTDWLPTYACAPPRPRSSRSDRSSPASHCSRPIWLSNHAKAARIAAYRFARVDLEPDASA